jgi:signal transduction histidine kinase
VRAVGGRLRVESQPGGGTTVEVVVPLVGAVLEA